MKHRKRFALAALCVVWALLLPALGAAETVPAVYWTGSLCVDGEFSPLLLDERGTADCLLYYKGSTYVPVRAAAAWLGCTIRWREEGTVLSLTREGTPGLIPAEAQRAATEAELEKFGRYKAEGCLSVVRRDMTVLLDGQEVEFATAGGTALYPLEFWDTVYLPLRTVGELCGKQVVWVPGYWMPNPGYPEQEPEQFFCEAEIYLFDKMTPEQLAAGRSYLDQVEELSGRIGGLAAKLAGVSGYEDPAFDPALEELAQAIQTLGELKPDCPALDRVHRSVSRYYVGYELNEELDFVRQAASREMPSIPPWDRLGKTVLGSFQRILDNMAYGVAGGRRLVEAMDG